MTTTLLHFLANTVELRYPHLVDFVAELRNVEEASKCELNIKILKHMYSWRSASCTVFIGDPIF